MLGRYLTARLIKASWITPARKDATGHIWFDQRDVHRAVKRLRRGGLALNGYAATQQQHIVTPARAKHCGID